MRTSGVGGGILKTATAIKPQLMTLLPMSVFLYAEQKTLEFAHKQIRESKRRKKKKRQVEITKEDQSFKPL